MSPQRPYLVLPSDIPDVEFHVLVCNGLDVEADGRNSGDVGVQLQLIKNRWGRTSAKVLAFCLTQAILTGLSCSVQAQHEQAHLS